MSTEITKKQKVIVLKKGMTFWVDDKRAESLETLLGGVTGHHFVKLDNETINTAEIEGIYTPEQYEQAAKIKQGMWQCPFRKWHERKGECYCQKEMRKDQDAKNRKSEFALPERTDKEQKHIIKTLAKVRKDLEAKGILPATK